MATVVDTVKEVSQAFGLKHITIKSAKEHVIHDFEKHIEHIKK